MLIRKSLGSRLVCFERYEGGFPIKETLIYSLVRLTLPGYNSFSRSLSVITPGVEFKLMAGGAEVKAVLAVPGEEIGLDSLGGLGETIACIGFGSRGEYTDNAEKDPLLMHPIVNKKKRSTFVGFLDQK